MSKIVGVLPNLQVLHFVGSVVGGFAEFVVFLPPPRLFLLPAIDGAERK